MVVVVDGCNLFSSFFSHHAYMVYSSSIVIYIVLLLCVKQKSYGFSKQIKLGLGTSFSKLPYSRQFLFLRLKLLIDQVIIVWVNYLCGLKKQTKKLRKIENKKQRNKKTKEIKKTAPRLDHREIEESCSGHKSNLNTPFSSFLFFVSLTYMIFSFLFIFHLFYLFLFRFIGFFFVFIIFVFALLFLFFLLFFSFSPSPNKI